MGVNRPFRARLLMARLIWAEYRRRYGKALDLLRRIEAGWPLDIAERAMKAMLLLRNDDPEQGHNLFIIVRDEAKPGDDPKSQYVRRYAEYWLAMIRWDPFNAGLACRQAAQIDCALRLKRYLWIPNGDAQNPLDLEFDAWVRAHPPGERGLRKPAVGGSS